MLRLSREQKTVTVRITIDLPMRFPKEWSNEHIEFHLNEGSWCANNIIGEIESYSEEHGCICGIFKAKVI